MAKRKKKGPFLGIYPVLHTKTPLFPLENTQTGICAPNLHGNSLDLICFDPFARLFLGIQALHVFLDPKSRHWENSQIKSRHE